MSTAAPPLRSPTSPHRHGYPSPQALSDADHCQVIPRSQPTSPRSPPPPPSSPPSLGINPNASSIQRARSGSRTYSEVQAEERELARRRTRSRERGEKVNDDEDLANQEGLSYGELKAEVRLSLALHPEFFLTEDGFVCDRWRHCSLYVEDQCRNL